MGARSVTVPQGSLVIRLAPLPQSTTRTPASRSS